MSDKTTSIAYENLNRRMFDGVGEYGIAQIKPVQFHGPCEFIGFNYAANATKRGRKGRTLLPG